MISRAKKILCLPGILLLAAVSSQAVAGHFVIDMQTDEGRKLAKTIGTDKYRYALFNEFSKDAPYSAIALSNSEGFKDGVVVYNAVINATEQGAKMIFTQFVDCGKLQTNEGFIEVNDQPIKVLHECREEKPGTKVSIFLPVSDAAQHYIYNAFAKDVPVKVRMDKHPVVFPTNGFLEAWSVRNKKAL
ncbi:MULTISPECIES: hypothetical protein [unclassified Pseudomonas]|uniref:hypothetical protein n=1 Tax=unclassified Pseudomonas TaxID=196821 RepID=UPI000883573C|nr:MULTISPECIES: hypothetical protein [unclassified Pseudomonas]QVM94848.1 hypothetical protein JYG36_17175 [Pseudomonas sp. SORT22]UVL58290.1 hypothetical protein LOY22_10130 [Pseudomonas sp. B21-035]SDQ80595.1 hypothetical protein SAMN05216487_3997 [Pseudomonas sp. UC 17F4]